MTGNWPPPRDPITGWEYLVLGLMIAGLVGIYLIGAEILYGDWRCALAACRIEK